MNTENVIPTKAELAANTIYRISTAVEVLTSRAEGALARGNIGAARRWLDRAERWAKHLKFIQG